MAEPSLPNSNSNPQICNQCGAEKSPYKDKRYPSSTNWRCNPCTNVRNRERYQQNLEQSREKGRQKAARYKETSARYYQQNKERLYALERQRRSESDEYKSYQREHYRRNKEHYRERAKDHYQENRESILKQQREYYQQNAEAAKTNAREWAKNNPDRVKETSRRYAENHREITRAAKRKWAAANPEYSQFKCAERRARKREVVNTLTTAEWKEIQLRFDYRCAYCGERKKLSIDHITPLNDFGGHTAENVVPACISCNSKKNAGPPPVPVQPLLIA